MKIKPKLIVFSLLSFMILVSCKKETTIKGRVYNPITGEGIEGAVVVASKSTMELPGGYEAVKETASDAEGDFVLQFKTKAIIKVGVSTEDYYEIGWYQNGEQLPSDLQVKKGETQYADFHAVPYGSIELHVKDTSCFNGQDKVSLYFDGETVPSNTYNKGLMTTLNGCVDITDPPLKCTIGKKYFHWVSTKNNIETTYYDTVFIDENQTTTLNVFY